MNKDLTLSVLREGRMTLEGQFIYGSNHTFLSTCQYKNHTLKAVYKPLSGERPLWDFPHNTLAKREVAAYLVSDALGWDLVPPTVFRTKQAPMGAGSLQIFIEHNPEYHYFTLREEDRVQLPKIMLFDLLINNADRKGGHLLFDSQGRLWLIDHGLSFHINEKLRTVVWDEAGKPIPTQYLKDLENLVQKLSPGVSLYQNLKSYLKPSEIDALLQRADKLLSEGIYPLPPEDRRAYPWPLL